MRATVAAAAARLVAAFGDGRVDCFAADASFVFYTTPERLESRAAYRSLWYRWETEDGFRVLECESSNRLITPVLNSTQPVSPPRLLRWLAQQPLFRRIPARLVGIGFRPEHVR